MKLIINTPVTALALVVYTLFAFTVSANNGGVHGPTVKLGTQSIEFRMNTTESSDVTDGRDQYRIHYQRAVNDEFQFRLIVQYRDFGTFEMDNVKSELLYNYQKATDGNYAAAFRFDLRARLGERPEDIAVHWTHQYNINDHVFARAIAIVGKNITDNSNGKKPTSIGSRFSITHRLENGLAYGAEMFNTYGEIDNTDDFEEQTHQFGPMVMYRKNDWYVYARYLKGLTSSTSDNNLQFRVGKNF